MRSRAAKTRSFLNGHTPAGFALLLTILVLVVLASVAAGLSMQLTMAKRRQQYRIEYQRARYGLDSAMKYVLSIMPAKTFELKPRLDAPDFSDLFWMTEAEYGQFIEYWASTATEEQIRAVVKPEALSEDSTDEVDPGLMSWLNSLFGNMDQPQAIDANGLGDPNLSDLNYEGPLMDIDPNDIEVPGPYGAPWPYVIKPIELKIGTSDVTITIEDENAKMPLSWMVTNFQKVNEQAEYSLETFAEWMRMSGQETGELKAELDEVYKQKMFKVNPSPILLKAAAPAANRQAPTGNQFTASRRRVSRTAPGQKPADPNQPAAGNTGVPNERPASAHAADFAKLFHSSLLDHEILSRPLPDTGPRTENAEKYLSLWGAQRININTAPRHVLEAAFLLAGDAFIAPELAQKVIERRKEKPFLKIDELKELGTIDSTTFEMMKNYIATTSSFFKIRVTSSSGNATATAVATVIKEGKNVERLAILYGY